MGFEITPRMFLVAQRLGWGHLKNSCLTTVNIRRAPAHKETEKMPGNARSEGHGRGEKKPPGIGVPREDSVGI